MESKSATVNIDLHWRPQATTMLQKSMAFQGPKAGAALNKKEQLSESVVMNVDDTTIIHTIYTKQTDDMNFQENETVSQGKQIIIDVVDEKVVNVSNGGHHQPGASSIRSYIGDQYSNASKSSR